MSRKRENCQRVRMTNEQKTALQSFCKKYPHVIQKKFTENFSFVAGEAVWDMCVESLNRLGPYKSKEKWKKCCSGLLQKRKKNVTKEDRGPSKNPGTNFGSETLNHQAKQTEAIKELTNAVKQQTKAVQEQTNVFRKLCTQLTRELQNQSDRSDLDTESDSSGLFERERQRY